MNRSAFFLLFAISLAGCHKLSDPEPAAGNPVNNQMTAVIDGEPWIATSISAQRSTSFISITGRSAEGEVITLYLAGIHTGEYSIQPGSKNFGSYEKDSASSSYKSNTPGGDGFVTLTGLDEGTKTITGKFHFIGISNTGDTVNVESGKLTRVSYSAGTVGGGKKEISAKVEGIDWDADNVFAISASGKITITGFRNDNTSLGLIFPLDITPGSYTLDSTGAYSARYQKNQSEILKSIAGTLIILAHNPGTKIINGQFSFESEVPGNPANKATITDGLFEAEYD